MKRFFIDEIKEPIVLRGDEHKHLTIVLRARICDEVVLCTGDGYDNVCKIEEIRKNETALSLCSRVKNEGEPTVNVTLFMSVMKGDKNDFVVQKATELGVNEIYPVITRYVQAHDKTVKTERLNKIALEAAKQCGRSVLTKVHDTIGFDELSERLSQYDLVVFPYENARKTHIKEFLSENSEKNIKDVAVFVGSEGGISEDEAAALANIGIVPVTLGKRILRAETANIAVLSAVMYELGQWK